ncbi:hypothetical protein JHK82_041295 [Glycine max]|nr:hypothetical protein JHK86_041356 [Glycine max]KAG5104325.1 hypothetical protein JHK82_041295 [Glycine max]KHN33367.1 Laccase-17 [Glycine soja]
MISAIPSSAALSVASLLVTSFLWTFPEIRLKNVTRPCHTKSMVTVNGMFPGPRVVAREGDRSVVKVVNHVNNITIHWHGVRQVGSGWSDGPSYITQCPIQSGQSYVYNFSMVGQRGTLFWHAHTSCGEWWNVDPEALITQALHTEGGPKPMLLTLNSDIILIGPVQTTSVVLKTKPAEYTNATEFFMLARPFFNGKGTFDNSTLNSAKYPANVPETVDRSFFFFTETCEGPNNRTKFSASMNNISFALPSVAILQQHFSGKGNNGVYTTDFPAVPLRAFNYTGTPPKNTIVKRGTKVVVIPFNTRMQLVSQDTSILSAESHPLHLHGGSRFWEL